MSNKSTVLNRLRIQSNEIQQDNTTYLNRLYKSVKSVFTPASGFGQLFTVVNNIGSLIFVYLENAALANNPLTAQNPIDIYGNAQLVGHDPYRGVASKGEIRIKFKPGKESEFNGPHISLPRHLKVNCLNNNMIYTIVFTSDYTRIEKNDVNFIYATIVQGEYKEQSEHATGLALQSYNINTGSIIDHDDIKVFVNGELWSNEKSLYDMNGRKKGVLIKTGLSGGIDLFFGNGSFGRIPEMGSEITVQYLEHNGSSGILDTTSSTIEFQFLDEGLDFKGNEVDLNEFMIIESTIAPSLGSDRENTNFTQIIAPLASKSFTLNTPESYEYFLSRYNSLSYIDAYSTVDDDFLDDDNIVYLFMLPDISRILSNSKDYFEIEEKYFTLTEEQENAIRLAINQSGQQATSSEVEIIKPIIKRYALNIILRYFEEYDRDSIRSEIKSRLGEYFTNTRRRDKLPKSDIIAIIENVEGVDSVNVNFVSEENEDAIRNGYYTKKTYTVKPTTPFLKDEEGSKKRFIFFEKNLIETKINLEEGEDPHLGLDEFGDIVIGENELPIIRGGWYDRNDIYYEETPTKGKPSSVSIYFKEKIEQNLNVRVQSQIRKNYT